MRVKNRLFLGLALSLVLTLLAGSLPPAGQSAAKSVGKESISIETLLREHEEELDNYKASLQQAGEDTFREKQGELLRAQAQALHNEAKKLRGQMEERLQALSEDISQGILRQQLQLMLVSLDAKQQEAHLARIAELETEMKLVQAKLEEEYQAQLDELQSEHEQRSRKEAALLKAEIEQAMDDEFAQYQLGLLVELETQIVKKRSTLASEDANR